MQNILCFGNPHIPEDQIAISLAKILKIPHFHFIIAESPSFVLDQKNDIWIMDLVKGIKKITILENIEDLTLCPSITCHDLDLGFYLKLMQETRKIQSIKIIGLPYGESNLQKLKKEVVNLLRNV